MTNDEPPRYIRSVASACPTIRGTTSTHEDMNIAVPASGSSHGSSLERVVEEDSRYARTVMNSDERSHESQHNIAQPVSQDTTSPHISIAASATAPSSDLINSPESTVFLGESNWMSTVSNPNLSAGRNNRGFQYLIPTAVSAKTVTTPLEVKRKEAKVKILSEDGAFSSPPNNSCETLFRAYFTWFHPCFPIIDRIGFYNSYISKTISPLLLQAVLFVGASYCNEKNLQVIGMPDRHDARSSFYNKAKDIYDVDYETNKVIVTQALFLMSFWRAGPLLEKDTRHWLGAAISLAQTKGMHRS